MFLQEDVGDHWNRDSCTCTDFTESITSSDVERYKDYFVGSFSKVWSENATKGKNLGARPIERNINNTTDLRLPSLFEKNAIYKQGKILLFRWVGLMKSYVIDRVGQQKSYVCLQGGWVGQKQA